MEELGLLDDRLLDSVILSGDANIRMAGTITLLFGRNWPELAVLFWSLCDARLTGSFLRLYILSPQCNRTSQAGGYCSANSSLWLIRRGQQRQLVGDRVRARFVLLYHDLFLNGDHARSSVAFPVAAHGYIVNRYIQYREKKSRLSLSSDCLLTTFVATRWYTFLVLTLLCMYLL